MPSKYMASTPHHVGPILCPQNMSTPYHCSRQRTSVEWNAIPCTNWAATLYQPPKLSQWHDFDETTSTSANSCFTWTKGERLNGPRLSDYEQQIRWSHAWQSGTHQKWPPSCVTARRPHTAIFLGDSTSNMCCGKMPPSMLTEISNHVGWETIATGLRFHQTQ